MCLFTSLPLAILSTDPDDDEIFGTQNPTTKSIKSSSKLTGVMKPGLPRAVVRPLHTTKSSSTLQRKLNDTRTLRPATSMSIRRPEPKVSNPAPRPGTSASNVRPRLAPAVSFNNRNSNQSKGQAKGGEWVDNGADKLAKIDDDLPLDVEGFRFEI